LIEALQQLVGQWNPKTRTRVARVASVVDAASALRRLGESFARFNGRWKGFVDAFDLTEINTIRDGYNRYYVLEKECSTGSAVLARRGFEPLPMLTAMSLLKKYPLLPDV